MKRHISLNIYITLLITHEYDSLLTMFLTASVAELMVPAVVAFDTCVDHPRAAPPAAVKLEAAEPSFGVVCQRAAAATGDKGL